MSRIVVVGAGPAGLIAAAEAAKRGNQVTLLEKNHKVGRKIYISGKGRCNLTNACDLPTLIKNIPGNGNFLYSAFTQFDANDVMAYFEQLGVRTKIERGNRVFPESDKAGDVVDALYQNVLRNGVQLQLQACVTDIQVTEDRKTVIYEQDHRKKQLHCDAIILATGGVSYPLTGSTGDGLGFAAAMGHTVVSLFPSLIPFVVSEPWIGQLQGLSLKNVSVKLLRHQKTKLFEDMGEMLFTHYGVSGPLILSASSHIRDFDYTGLQLIIDLKPALSLEQLDQRIQKDFGKYIRKSFQNALDDLLPKSLIPIMVLRSGIEGDRPVNQITKEERRRLAELLKSFSVTPVEPRPIAEAIVTAGGISIKEIHPKTMESKLVPGVFFAGEMIDVDAYTGGFNLTIAFSTGYAAGCAAGMDESRENRRGDRL